MTQMVQIAAIWIAISLLPCDAADSRDSIAEVLLQVEVKQASQAYNEAEQLVSAACKSARELGSADRNLVAKCELAYAYLLESWPGHSKDARQHYETAMEYGNLAQQALARNNIAFWILGKPKYRRSDVEKQFRKIDLNFEKPGTPSDLRSFYTMNLGDARTAMGDWPNAFDAYARALRQGGEIERFSEGILAIYPHLRRNRGSLAAAATDLLTGRDAPTDAIKLARQTLLMGSGTGPGKYLDPARWLHFRKGWPAPMEALLRAYSAASVGRSSFEKSDWQDLIKARGQAGPGSSLWISVTAIGEIFGIKDPEAKKRFHKIITNRRLDPEFRQVLDQSALSSLLYQVASLDEFSDQGTDAIFRHSAAFAADPANSNAAVSAATLLSRDLKDLPGQSKWTADNEKLKSDLLQPYRPQSLVQRTLAFLRGTAWDEAFYGLSPTQLDWDAFARVYLLLAAKASAEEKAALLMTLKRRAKLDQDETPGSVYLIIGQIIESQAESFDAYLHAARQYIKQNRVNDAAFAIENAVRLENSAFHVSNLFPPALMEGWKDFGVRIAPSGKNGSPTVSIKRDGKIEEFTQESVGANGVSIISLSAPLLPGQKVTISYGHLSQELFVDSAPKSSIDSVYDRERIVSGVAQSDTDVVRLEITSSATAPARRLEMRVDPYTRRFRVLLRNPLVSGEHLSLTGLCTQRKVESKDSASIDRLAGCASGETGRVPLLSKPEVVHQRPLDWGRNRFYVTAGSMTAESNVHTTTNLYLDFTIDHNWKVWNKPLLVTAPEKEATSRISVLLNSYVSGRIAPLVATTPEKLDPGRVAAACKGDVDCEPLLVQPVFSASYEVGVYAPIILRRFTYPVRGRRNALFFGPLAKGGVQSITNSQSDPGLIDPKTFHQFRAAGARLGHFRFVSDENTVSPSLLTYFDFTWGRWDRFRLLSANNNIDAPTRFEASGFLQIPRTTAYVGFASNFGQSVTDHRLFFGVRVDLGKSLSKMPFIGFRVKR